LNPAFSLGDEPHGAESEFFVDSKRSTMLHCPHLPP
jgi:hypothetical protein